MEFAGATFSLPYFSVCTEGLGRVATQESADWARQVRRPQAAAITSQGAVPQLSDDGFSGISRPDQYRLT